MADNESLVLDIVDGVGLEEEAELIRAIGTLARDWVQLAGEVGSGGSVLELVRSIAEGTTDPNVAAAFTKIGAEDLLAKLQAGAGRLKALLDRVPKVILQLLEPIGKFDESGGVRDGGLIVWPLLDESVGASSDTGKPSYSLSFGATAGLSIEAGDTWPYSDPMPSPLLRMKAEGGLKAKGDATLPFTVGAAKVSASASVACALEYYFAAADPAQIYALAVGERLPKLVNPFDFDAVWNGFARSDLAGIHYRFDGSAAAKLSVSVADATMPGAGINAELGATISVGFKLDGHYFLTLRAGPKADNGEPRIIASLSREKARQTDFGLGLGATVDLSSLARNVHKVLAGALDKWDDVLRQVTPYLSPGTLVQEKVQGFIEASAAGLVKDADFRKAMVRDLQTVIGIDTQDEAELANWLTGQLAGALNTAKGWAEEQRAAAIDSMLDSLAGILPGFAETKIRAKLEGVADNLIAKASDELQEIVGQLFAGEREALGRALEKIGVTVAGKIKTADDALKGVRELISRYDRLFRKVLVATEDAARAKISVAIQIEESRASAATLEVAGTFLSKSQHARKAFRALTQGNFDTLIELVANGEGGVDFALDPEKSSLRRYAGSAGKYGIELVLFGFGITGSELLSAEAEVIIDGTGKIQVDAKASLKRRFSGLDAEREIVLLSSYSLVQARALASAPPAADRSLGLSLSIGHIDEGLKRHEVRRFVGSLVTAGMVDETASKLADETFTRWIGNPGSNGKLSGALELKLALERKGIANLLSLTDVDSYAPLPQLRREYIIRKSFEFLRASTEDARVSIDQTAADLKARRGVDTLDELLFDRLETDRALHVRVSGSNIRQIPDAYQPFASSLDLSYGMYEMVEKLREIYYSRPEAFADDDRRTWAPKEYRDAEARAVRSVRGWLQLNEVLFWTNSEVHARTIAFLRTVSSLAAVDLTQNVSLIMTRKDKEIETVVLRQSEG